MTCSNIVLPKELLTLNISTINQEQYDNLLNNFPQKLASLYIRGNITKDFQFNKLPLSLQNFDFNPTTIDQSFDDLPSNLKKLEISSCEINCPLGTLPNSLKKLYINCGKFDHPLNNLPENLSKLLVGSYEFKYPLDNLPRTLNTLLLDSAYNLEIQNLPESLRHIEKDSNDSGKLFIIKN
jgi:hypothetical protein